MKYLLSISLFFLATACVVDPIDLENDVDCVPDSFIGEWEYQSTNGTRLDSIQDIEITRSDDDLRGEILINGRYFDIKPGLGCTAGSVSGILSEVYELKSERELHKRSTVVGVFGSVTVYEKK